MGTVQRSTPMGPGWVGGPEAFQSLIEVQGSIPGAGPGSFTIVRTPTTWEEAVRAVLSEMYEVMVERQDKYGPNNIRAMGMRGVMMRARDDKMNRAYDHYEREDLRQRCLDAGIPQATVDEFLPSKNQDFADEKIEDIHIDCANYVGPIALMLRRGWWDLPRADAV